MALSGDCPILVWMISLNREYTEEEYDACYALVEECVPHVDRPYRPTDPDSFRNLIISMLPLLMMRHRRIPRAKWRDCVTQNGKHWIEQDDLPPEKFLHSMIGYHLSYDHSLCGMAMTQGPQKKVINIGLAILCHQYCPYPSSMAFMKAAMAVAPLPNIPILDHYSSTLPRPVFPLQPDPILPKDDITGLAKLGGGFKFEFLNPLPGSYGAMNYLLLALGYWGLLKWVFIRGLYKKTRRDPTLVVMNIQHPLRDGIRETAVRLQEDGVRVVMVTSDDCSTADSVAKRSGIYTAGGLSVEGLYFLELPEPEKERISERLQVLTAASVKEKQSLVEYFESSGEVVEVYDTTSGAQVVSSITTAASGQDRLQLHPDTPKHDDIYIYASRFGLVSL